MQSVIQKFRERGHLVPSSRFLVRKLIQTLDYTQSLTVVQLGFGTGVVTRAILNNLSACSRLSVIELDPACQKYCPQDSRLDYITGSAVTPAYYPPDLNAVVSTLPLASLPAGVTRAVLDTLAHVMPPKSRFTQFQYSLITRKAVEQALGPVHQTAFEWRNLPPAFIYTIIRP